MREKLFLAGMLGIILAFGIVSVGCDNSGGGDSGPKKYTVTFEFNGGTLTSGQATQEIEENKTASVPAVTPPADKEADGWTSSVPAIAVPTSPITADVTFTAKWKDKTPNTPAPPANELANTVWYKGGLVNNPQELLIFSGADTDGKYYLYQLKNKNNNRNGLAENNTLDTSTPQLYITGTPHVYVRGTSLTVNTYYDDQGQRASVPFTRIEGSTKTNEYDVWYTAGRTTNDVNRAVLAIKSNNTIFTATDQEWTRKAYTIRPTDTPSINRIEFSITETLPYTLEGTTTLSITGAGWGDYTKTNL
jgi:hypothetical protein